MHMFYGKKNKKKPVLHAEDEFELFKSTLHFHRQFVTNTSRVKSTSGSVRYEVGTFYTK